MTPEEQIQYLGLDKLVALDKLNVLLHGNFKITGSFSLLEFGVIERKIGDLDIVVDSLDTLKVLFDKKGYDFQEWFDYSEPMENSKKTLQGKGKVTNRISFKIDGVKCCAFLDKNYTYKTCKYLDGRKFKVLLAKYSIQAKKRFVKYYYLQEFLFESQLGKLKKHNRDIEDYLSANIKSETDSDKLPF